MFDTMTNVERFEAQAQAIVAARQEAFNQAGQLAFFEKAKRSARQDGNIVEAERLQQELISVQHCLRQANSNLAAAVIGLIEAQMQARRETNLARKRVKLALRSFEPEWVSKRERRVHRYHQKRA